MLNCASAISSQYWAGGRRKLSVQKPYDIKTKIAHILNLSFNCTIFWGDYYVLCNVEAASKMTLSISQLLACMPLLNPFPWNMACT